MGNPWLGIGLVLALFAVLTAGLHTYRRSRAADPELVRKGLHMGMGVVALALPWLFTSTWPVLLLAAMFVLGLSGRRTSRSLHGILGGVIDGVGRSSLGEICFPLAVGLLFVISGGDPLTFCIPMLILTLADAAAALVGARYGTRHLLPAREGKSIEGSLAFFVLAFLSTQVPLLLFTDTGRTETLLIALSLALHTMLLEAIAGRGLDNLLIPLGGFFLLRTLGELDVTALLAQMSIALLMVLCVLIWINGRGSGRTNRSDPVDPRAIERQA